MDHHGCENCLKNPLELEIKLFTTIFYQHESCIMCAFQLFPILSMLCLFVFSFKLLLCLLLCFNASF